MRIRSRASSIRLAATAGLFALLLAVPVRAAPAVDVSAERAVDFRAEFGLRHDAPYLASLVLDPTVSAGDYGIPLTADEVTDLDRRGRISSLLDDVDELAASLPDVWGGVHIDQARGGVIVLSLTDIASEAQTAAFIAASPAGYQTEIRTVKNSLTSLIELKDMLRPHMASGVGLGEGVVGMGLDIPANAVRVRILSSRYQETKSLLVATFSDDVFAFEMAESPDTEDACISRVSCYDSPWRAGIKIYAYSSSGVLEGYCTSAFVSYPDAGARMYLVTAGHCGGAYYKHDGRRIGDVILNSMYNGTRCDCLTIEIDPGWAGHKLLKLNNGESTVPIPGRDTTVTHQVRRRGLHRWRRLGMGLRPSQRC